MEANRIAPPIGAILAPFRTRQVLASDSPKALNDKGRLAPARGAASPTPLVHRPPNRFCIPECPKPPQRLPGWWHCPPPPGYGLRSSSERRIHQAQQVHGLGRSTQIAGDQRDW